MISRNLCCFTVLYFINIYIFDYPDPRLSRLFSLVPTSPDNRGLTVLPFRFLACNVAKCNLGEVKLERVGLRSSPITVCDMRGGPLGSCRASLGVCNWCCTALFALLADHCGSSVLCTFLRIIADSHSPPPPFLLNGWWFNLYFFRYM